MASRDLRVHRENNRKAAYKVVHEIYERAQILRDFPEIGHRYETRPGVRILLYGHYRLPYTIAEDGTIYIRGVYHGRMDLERHLK